MGWNGLDLVNDFSGELGDTSTAFKLKVLRYINDGLRDIATTHNWPFLREKGKAVLAASQEIQSIVIPKPSAPTVAVLAGGSLTTDVEYKFLITFNQSQADVESIAGEASAGVTPTGADLSVTLAAIPVSTNPLVTARKIYVSKGGASYAYHSTISDNTTLTIGITTNTTSVITPPEENFIHELDGEFYLEGSRILKGSTVQDIIFRTNGFSSTGTPQIWAPVNAEEIMVYPKPSTGTTASFFYFKLPRQIFGISTSIPQMPSWIYDDLRRYVMWRGFDYRDRSGKESKEITYRENLKLTISRKGSPIKKSGSVRVVTPDSDGFIY